MCIIYYTISWLLANTIALGILRDIGWQISPEPRQHNLGPELLREFKEAKNTL